MNYPSDIRNRTLEFQQCVQNFERQDSVSGRAQKPIDQNNRVVKNEFTRQATSVAKDIAQVTGSLAKLAQLAKKKQLFNERASDIIELTYVVKQDIFRIEKSLKGLQKEAGNKSGSSNNQVNAYNKNVVQLLNTKTKNISEAFKDVLQVRQQSEIAQRSRQEQLLATAKNGNQNLNTGGSGVDSFGALSTVPYALRNKMNISASGSSAPENPFLNELPKDSTADPDVSDISKIDSPEGDVLALPDQSQQLMLLEEQDSRYLQQRNRAVETIESTINEVGGLFQQLATMVQEQGESIQRIDDNVTDVNLNIGGAHRELLKYYNSISNNRWLIIKIFGILILFFLLWVLVS